MVREQRKPRCFRCLPLSACKLVGVGQRQRGLQQELRDAQEALAKDLGAVDSQRDAADTSIESLETKKLQLRQQLHTIDEKLHAAREGQRNYLAEKDRRRRALEEVEATFRKNLSEVEELGLAARKERAAAEKALADCSNFPVFSPGISLNAIPICGTSTFQASAVMMCRMHVAFLNPARSNKPLLRQRCWQCAPCLQQLRISVPRLRSLTATC